MEPEDLAYTGVFILVLGVGLSVFGMILFDQAYSCLFVSTQSCNPNLASRLPLAFPLIIFGGYAIILGGVATCMAYVAAHLRPQTDEESEDENS